MKFLAPMLIWLMIAAPTHAQTSAPGRLLAPTMENAPSPSIVTPADPSAFIQVKQAVYGPFWGKYRSLQAGMLTYCGDASSFCEVYCPKSHKTCFVVYSCGQHVTKSLETRSGEMIVMDCRTTALGVGH